MHKHKQVQFWGNLLEYFHFLPLYPPLHCFYLITSLITLKTIHRLLLVTCNQSDSATNRKKILNIRPNNLQCINRSIPSVHRYCVGWDCWRECFLAWCWSGRHSTQLSYPHTWPLIFFCAFDTEGTAVIAMIDLKQSVLLDLSPECILYTLQILQHSGDLTDFGYSRVIV